MGIDVRWCLLHEPYPRVRRSRDSRHPVEFPHDVPCVAKHSARGNDLGAVARADSPPFQVNSPLGLGLRLVRTMFAVQSGLPNSEGVGQRQGPVEHLVRRLQPRFGCGGRGVEAAVHLDGLFHPEAVKIREVSGEQSGDPQPCGDATFLDQAETPHDHAVVVRAAHPRVLMVDGDFVAWPREYTYHELGAVVLSELP